AQCRRVLDQELHRQAPLDCLGPSPPDRLFHEVDAGNPEAPGGEEQGVFARAAAGVKERAGNPIGDRGEPRLRPTDVPGRRPGVEFLKVARSTEWLATRLLWDMVMTIPPLGTGLKLGGRVASYFFSRL